MIAELVPPACEYWNLQLCNHWLESLDYWQHTVSVNHASAVKGADGEGARRDRPERSGRSQLAR